MCSSDLAPVSCLEDEVNQCGRQEGCATLELWKQLDEAIKGVVDNVTLEKLVEWQREKVDNYMI